MKNFTENELVRVKDDSPSYAGKTGHFTKWVGINHNIVLIREIGSETDYIVVNGNFVEKLPTE